jgi:hypothetical protein
MTNSNILRQVLELAEADDLDTRILERKKNIIKYIQGELEKASDVLMKDIKGKINYAEIKVACTGILDLAQTRDRLEKEGKTLEKKA